MCREFGHTLSMLFTLFFLYMCWVDETMTEAGNTNIFTSNETADEIDTGLQLHCATVAMTGRNARLCEEINLSIFRQLHWATVAMASRDVGWCECKI